MGLSGPEEEVDPGVMITTSSPNVEQIASAQAQTATSSWSDARSSVVKVRDDEDDSFGRLMMADSLVDRPS
jgi:hypothetical protein